MTKSMELLVAASRGHTTQVRHLLRTRVSPNWILRRFVVEINIDELDENGGSALLYAASNGHVEIVELLLQYQANINLSNTLGVTPLMCASYQGHQRIVELLLNYRDNLNRRLRNKYGWFAPCDACWAGYDELSINFEVALNQRDNMGRSAIYYAVSQSQLEVATLLLAAGANPNIVVTNGCTPLFCALRHNDYPMVSLLLSKGDLQHTLNGQTPLDYATDHHQPEMVKLLRHYQTLRRSQDTNKIKAGVAIVLTRLDDANHL